MANTNDSTPKIKSVISNSFNTIVNRPTSESKSVISNSFNMIINRPTQEITKPNTVVNILKDNVMLTPVKTTPQVGEYKVTIIKCTNCSAELSSDNKTIVINTVTSSNGKIDISIDIESKKTYSKTISVAKILDTATVTNEFSRIDQKSDRIEWLVKGTSSSSMELTKDALSIITKQVKITGDMLVDGAINGKTIIGATILNSATNPSFSVDPQGNVVASKITIKGGNITLGNNFKVTEDGTLTGKNVKLSGDITALTGKIGGFTISENDLVGTNVGMGTETGSNLAFWAGSDIPTEAPFNVNHEGKLNSSDINVTGGTINVNDNFKVRDDGTCEAKDLLIEGRISCKEIIAESSNVEWQDKSLVRNCKVYVTYGYTYPDDFDENNFEDGMTFASFADLQDVVPRNLNGYTLDVYVTKKHTETINLDNFNNGRVRIAMQGHQLNGSIAFYGHGMDYEFYGNKPGSVNDPSMYCNIVPGANGRVKSGYRYCLVADRCRVTVYDVRCYSGTATDYANNGICCTNGANAYLASISAINSPYALVRCHSASHVYIASSSGRTSAQTFHCVSGSIIQLNKGTHCGTTSSKGAKYINNNGQIFDTGVTYDSTTKDDTSTPTPDVPKIIKVTKTIKSSSGRSWRTSGSYANSWSSEAIVRQGAWTSGYGKNVGYWFFGNDIYNILQNPDYTITGMKVKVTRQSGGRNASVVHYLRAHTYSKKTSGTPSQLGTGVINKKFSLATGSSITLTLSSSEISSLISSNARGLGICTSDYTTGANGSYSCCSASCSVTITYTTTE